MIKKETHTPKHLEKAQAPRSVGYLTKGAAAASVTGLVFMMSPAHQAMAADNPFLQKFGADNPLHAPIGVDSYRHRPALADIDDDGDLDLFIGNGEGGITYFENTGTDSSPEFTRRTGTADPFNGMDIDDGDTDYAAPAFADMDGDDDLDLAVGADDGYIHYFENTGTISAPEFTERTGSDSPFDGFNVGSYSTPQFADIEPDGDMDVVVGRSDGYIDYLENTGGAFTRYTYTQTQNPFAGVDVGWDSAPGMFADIDADGDIDWFGGQQDGYIYFLENNGNGTFTSYNNWSTSNPFYQKDVDDYAAPVFADLDNDGDLDAIVGDEPNEAMPYQLYYYENVGSNAAPLFTERTGSRSPFDGFDVGTSNRPTLEMALDLLNDSWDGGEVLVPFLFRYSGTDTKVVFGDVDGDGDLDAFATGGKYWDGETYSYGRVHFFENTGTATEPVFEKRGDADNPLQSVNEGAELNPPAWVALGDIDGDGDLDAFVGNISNSVAETYSPYYGDGYNWRKAGSIDFYENVGGGATATASVGGASGVLFEKRGDAANPLFFVDDPNYSLSFVDIDGDGDLDAFASSTRFSYSVYEWYSPPYWRKLTMQGEINFYENKGDAQNPDFGPGVSNPLKFVFDNLDEEYSSAYSLAFGDIDGDGDLDATVGMSTYSKYSQEFEKQLRMYENVGSATDPGFAPTPEADDLAAKMKGQVAQLQTGEDELAYTYLTPAVVDIDGDGDLDVFAGEKYGRFVFFQNQTDPEAATPVYGSSSSSSTCFVDTAQATAADEAGNGNMLIRSARRLMSMVTAIWR